MLILLEKLNGSLIIWVINSFCGPNTRESEDYFFFKAMKEGIAEM